MNDRISARRLHESTKHGTPAPNRDRLVEYRRLDPSNAPRPFKRYNGLAEIALPREIVPSSIPAPAVLSGDEGAATRLDTTLLSTLLFLSAGVTRTAGLPGRRLYFRAAMSAGNLHPVEVYVAVGEGGIGGLDPGVYHFDPLGFLLRRLRDHDLPGSVAPRASASIVLTGIPWRTTWKYGERGWRHLYWDCGTLLANLLGVAAAHGLDPHVALGFDDQAVSDLVGIDGVDEMPLAVVTFGVPPNDHLNSRPVLEPLAVDVDSVAPRPIRLPLLQEAQRGSNLDGSDVDDWRRAASTVVRHASSDVLTSPPESDERIEDVILRRGSTRAMVHRPVPRQHLDWPLAASTRPIGADALGEGTVLDHFVNVHDVDTVDPGVYRTRADGLQVIREVDSIREQSAALCLGQPLGGDSAYTVFHCAELEPIFEALGSRGYRVAQLEAGVVSGRLALCAFALGLGATGLTFFDDPVSTFFETGAQPMLVTSVGAASTTPAPAGTPGSPAVLRS